MIKNYKQYIKEGNVGMSSYISEYPYQYNTMDNPADRGKEGNIEYYKSENNFQSIQNEIKNLIHNDLSKTDKNITEQDIEQELRNFFNISDVKKEDIRTISDNCKNVKKCALEIYNKYKKYSKINNDQNINESKLNGKYGFFMFLEIIDEMKNSFIKENHLNTSDFNMFFTTDKILDKNKLTNILEYKNSIDVSYQTLIHIRNLRLSFYFGIRNFVLEYGFHDDLKRMVYKTGEFKITSSFLKNLSNYKCITLINNILKNSNLKNLVMLQNIKNDNKNLIDKKFTDIKIYDDRVIKKINNIELNNYIKNDISEFFDSWSFKHKWYYSTYNYIDINELDTDFHIKLKDPDKDLNLLKRTTDIKNITENVDDPLKHVDQEKCDNPEIFEPMNREPLEALPLKINKKNNKKSNKKTNTKEEKIKEKIKYYTDLEKSIKSINKDISKNNGYLTKYLYKIVGKYQRSFEVVKNDMKWLNNKLLNDPEFINNLKL
jgi:hypothetical protein